ncbi:MAG: hypothetical protein A2910_01985 [Candidatus Yanofskybacteria bacterium RIFCSPLOWO2_01_FULL_39_28]|nr:MAG: hypothetical protein A2910_01985 [Candidatus Yanofskybacteria bacterium RIFCSPLOWO2_01_FULL_39_28]
MGFFTKEKITTEKITETLLDFFDADYQSLIDGIKKLDDKILISEEQQKELLVLPVMATIITVNSAFGNSEITKNILDKFYRDILSKYFQKSGEIEQFNDLYYERNKEYSEALRIEAKGVNQIALGKVFCNNFFKEKETGKNLPIMLFVRGSLSAYMINKKEFLDSLSSKFEIV